MIDGTESTRKDFKAVLTQAVERITGVINRMDSQVQALKQEADDLLQYQQYLISILEDDRTWE